MGRIHGPSCRKKEIEEERGYIEPIPFKTISTEEQATQLVETCPLQLKNSRFSSDG